MKNYEGEGILEGVVILHPWETTNSIIFGTLWIWKSKKVNEEWRIRIMMIWIYIDGREETEPRLRIMCEQFFHHMLLFVAPVVSHLLFLVIVLKLLLFCSNVRIMITKLSYLWINKYFATILTRWLNKSYVNSMPLYGISVQLTL